MPELKDTRIRFGSASRSAGSVRPAGFRSGTPAEPSPENKPESEKPERRKFRGLFRRSEPRIKKAPGKKAAKRRASKQKKARAKKHFGRSELILILVIILIMGAVAAAIILLGNKPAHQMPTITLTTEEPTESPEETIAPSDGSQ